MSGNGPIAQPRRTVQVDESFFLDLIEVMRYKANHEHGGDWENEVHGLLYGARLYMSPELKELERIKLKEETKYRNRRLELFPQIPLAAWTGDAEGWQNDTNWDSDGDN